MMVVMMVMMMMMTSFISTTVTLHVECDRPACLGTNAAALCYAC